MIKFMLKKVKILLISLRIYIVSEVTVFLSHQMETKANAKIILLFLFFRRVQFKNFDVFFYPLSKIDK